MKFLLTSLTFIFLTTYSFSQDVSFGVEVSPAFKLQSIRNKASGLTTSISGYGFSAGIPIRFDLDKDAFFTTGLNYDFTAFDQKVNNFLITSIRLNSINIPLVYNYPIINNFMLNAGGGIKYIFIGKQLGAGTWLNINPVTNNIQPFISLGLSTTPNDFEIGVDAKYHFINLWSNSQNNSLTTTKLVEISLNLKYYF